MKLRKILLGLTAILLAAFMLSGCVTVSLISAAGVLTELLGEEKTTATVPAAPQITEPASPTEPPKGTIETPPISSEDADWVTKLLFASDPALERDSSGHAMKNLSELTYTVPDTDAIEKKISTMETMLEAGTDSASFTEIYNGVIVEYEYLDTQIAIAEIVSDLDVTNTKASEDKIAMQDVSSELFDRLVRLSDAALDSSIGHELEEIWGEEYTADIRRKAKLTSEEIQPMVKELNRLSDEYDKLTTTYTVDVNGKPMTIEQLSDSYLELGYDYFTYLMTYYKNLNRDAGELFLKIVKLNNETAKLLGYRNFAEYQYECYGRDYTPEDAASMAAAVKKYLVPLYRRLESNPPEAVEGADTSMTGEESLEKLQVILPYLSEDMAKAADFMTEYKLYDITSGANKNSGAYTISLDLYGVPYINAKCDREDNLSTLFHEFGHFYNFYTYPHADWGTITDLDLAEIHSQGLELLLMLYYNRIYSAEEAECSKASQLNNMVWVVLSGCMEDEFQRILYEEENLTVDRLNEIYRGLLGEYHMYESYGLSSDYFMLTWVDIPHTFQSPFYYISYATSLVSAMEIWELSETDPSGAIDLYLKVQSHPCYEPFKETLTSCGMKSPFEETTIRELGSALETYFGKLWREEK